MRSRRGERGFTLVESLLAIGLTAAVMLGVSGAVVRALHASTRGVVRAALADHALNVLSDIRMTTAYDRTALAALVGTTSTATVTIDGRALTVDVAVTQAPASRPNAPAAPIVAHVTVGDPDGERVSEDQVLYHEAPVPGSIVDGAAAAAPPPPPPPGTLPQPGGAPSPRPSHEPKPIRGPGR